MEALDHTQVGLEWEDRVHIQGVLVLEALDHTRVDQELVVQAPIRVVLVWAVQVLIQVARG